MDPTNNNQSNLNTNPQVVPTDPGLPVSDTSGIAVPPLPVAPMPVDPLSPGTLPQDIGNVPIGGQMGDIPNTNVAPLPGEMPVNSLPPIPEPNLEPAIPAQEPNANISAITPDLSNGGSDPLGNVAGDGLMQPSADLPQQPISTEMQTPNPSLEVNGMPLPSGVPTESAPTDLSHLVGGVLGATPDLQPNVVIPTPAVQDTPQVVTNNSGGFPKWLLAVGGVLLLLVIGGSAYIILGVGKSEETLSVPAEQQTLTNPPRSVIPTTVLTAVPATSGADTSATFGDLEGGSQATTSANGSSGQSALERLKQKYSNQATP